MAGYERQSIADILPGEEVRAEPLNAEFNRLQLAFNAANGHTHDGSSGSAPPINLNTSITGFLPVVNGGIGGRHNLSATTDPTNEGAAQGAVNGSLWINTTTNQLFIYTASGWSHIPKVNNNQLNPNTNNTVSLGSSTNRFLNGNFGGTLTTTFLASTTLSGTLAANNFKITGLATPTLVGDAATKGYVDTAISNLIASSPSTLDTLKELADALGNDPQFATTVMNNIATKVSKSGDTMTGPLAMSNQKITGLAVPTNAADAANKNYVDGILGSSTSAAASAADANNQRSYAQEWATKPENTLVSTAAGGNGSSDYSSLHWASKSSQSASGSANSASNSANSATDAANQKNYAQEWAQKNENSPVSAAAGGDGSTTFSAKHWAAKAAASAATVTPETGNSIIDKINSSGVTGKISGNRLPLGTDLAIGVVALTDSVSSTLNGSGGRAATPLAVKTAYDLAATKLNTSAKATGAQLRELVDNTNYLTSKTHADAAAYNTLTSSTGAFIPSQVSGINYNVTLASNVTVGDQNLFTYKEGTSGVFVLKQDSTGGRTVTWASIWDFGADGPPTIRTAPNAVDYVFYVIKPGATGAICSYKAGS